MFDFFVTLFAWIGFTVVIGVLIVYWRRHPYCRDPHPAGNVGWYQPPVVIARTPAPTGTASSGSAADASQAGRENFIVDLNAFHTELPTVYNKSCAFTGVLPPGHIPGLPYKYASVLP